ncbi:MAG: TlpA disulfide reductase family protein [Proteobacteria bacterium]|nr:TlpA disulfide reductase family protein [Pseudomonadota bacterium]
MVADPGKAGLGRTMKIGLALTVPLALAAAILIISRNLASDDRESCRIPGKALQSIQSAVPPKPVPAVSFADAGANIPLADFRGRGVVLNFWATWCAPCVREMPELDRLAPVAKAAGVDVVTVSMDREGRPVIDKFFAVNNLANLPRYHDPKGVAGRALGVRGLPTTILITPDGKEIGRIEGTFKFDSPEMADFVRDCLGPGANAKRTTP